MKIGQHCVDDAETVSRIDKQARFAAHGAQLAAFGGAFQAANDSRAYCDHATAPLTGAAHRFADFLRDLDPFRVHPVLAYVGGPHRLESAGADVQGQPRLLHALFNEAVEHGLVEMQAGGRRRHRAWPIRVYSLVSLAIQRLVGTLNIRR
ncbi:hypothetical protein MnTg04_01563 [bacterium MnTg04]|nr:hypothetical protein MnTg04_01563 [bacterium MnTg04]